MCWISKQKPELKIAENDIPVKKILLNNSGSLYSPIFCDTEWKFNTIEVTELGKAKYYKLSDKFSVRYGFHSCEDIHKVESFFVNKWINKCSNHLFNIDDGEEVFNAIIPKGSKYYKNEEGDYVSDKLMIIGE